MIRELEAQHKGARRSRPRRRDHALRCDFVDELRLVIAPTIAGRGRRLLDGLPSIRLETIRSEVSPTGYLLVDYRVVR